MWLGGQGGQTGYSPVAVLSASVVAQCKPDVAATSTPHQWLVIVWSPGFSCFGKAYLLKAWSPVSSGALGRKLAHYGRALKNAVGPHSLPSLFCFVSWPLYFSIHFLPWRCASP